MKPSDVSPLVQLETALDMLGLESEAISDIAEIQELLRTLMIHEMRLYLVDVRIHGVYDWEVDQSPTTQKEPGLFDIEYQEEGLNEQQFHSHKDEIYIHYDGIGSSDGEVSIQSRGFMYHGDKYYCSDASGMLVTYQFGLSHIYVLREQILGLLSSADQNPKATENSEFEVTIAPGKKIKPKSVLDVRLLIFQTWLVTKVNEKSGNKKFTTKDLQDCYEIIGYPTHKEVWAALQGIDRANFSSGFDEFKKHSREVVTFKTGSKPKHQNA